MSKIATFFQTHARTLGIWALLLLVCYGLVAYNHANQRRQEAALVSPQQGVRDEMVQSLVQHGSLVDTLINTENPNEDPASEQNTLSVEVRQNAVDSVNRLAAQRKISVADAMETLFQLHKDGDKGVQGKATDGLVALAGQSDSNLQEVVAHLSNGDPDIRAAAGAVLAKIGGDKTARAVDPALSVPASADAASSTLLAIGEPAAPLLVAHLEDPARATDVAFRQQIATMLDTLASPSTIPELVKLSGQSGQPAVQRQSQIALADTVIAAYVADENSRTALTKAQEALGKADSQSRDAAAKAVGDAQKAVGKAAAALPAVRVAEMPLRAILSNLSADSLAREQAALALGRIGTPGAVGELVAFLGDLDFRVRESALAGISRIGVAAVPALLTTLAQGTAQSRAGAAEALGNIGNPAAQAALTGILSSPATPPEVRQAAIVGLGRSGNPAVIPVLVRALGDPDGGVESAASIGLLSPDLEKTAIPALVAAFSSPTPAPLNASQTLSRMGSLIQTDVLPALGTAAASGNPQAETWAAVTLGETGSKDASVIASLRGLAQSKDLHVQYAASQALAQLSAEAA